MSIELYRDLAQWLFDRYEEGQPRRHDVGDQRGGGRCDGTGPDESGQVLGRGP